MRKSDLGHQPTHRNAYMTDARGAMDWLAIGGNISVSPVGEYAFIDIDTNDATLIARIGMALGAGVPHQHWTPRGGSHILVAKGTDRLVNGSHFIDWAGGQIDIKGFGRGYVIGPGSKTENGHYTGRLGNVVPVMDDAALDRIVLATNGTLQGDRKESKPLGKYVGAAVYTDHGDDDLDDLAYYLDHIPPDIEMRDWLAVIFGARDRYGANGYASAALQLVDGWSARGTKYRDGEPAKVWHSRGNGNGRRATFATVVHLAVRHGATRRTRPVIEIPDGDWSGKPLILGE